MKKIECIIRSEKLIDVIKALKKAGIGGMTVSEVRGFGIQSDRPGNFLFVHKTKIEIYATDIQAKKIVPHILFHCSAGRLGDGKIAVMPLDDCVRIRTGERRNKAILAFAFLLFTFNLAYATPTTLIWAPSTDIQLYKKIHIGYDLYAPTTSKGTNSGNYDQHNYVLQVWGPTFSLLSDKPEDNLLGKIWLPLGKIMAETGFDYKKGLGSFYDSTPWYFHFKLAVPEEAYFKNMPAIALGSYDMGTRANRTNNNIWYGRIAKTLNIGKVNLGRVSGGYFVGNGRLLRDKDSLRDNAGPMVAWERIISEINDKLWLCVDYQGTQSSYGALNAGFAWSFTKDISTILAYDIYNNRNLTDTITFQLDINF